MKKALLIFALAGTTFFAHGQTTPMTDNGYWVIESNKHTPKQNLVKFYNLDNKLIYQEAITGKRVKINNNKTRAALNDVLKKALEGTIGTEPVLAMELFNDKNQ